MLGLEPESDRTNRTPAGKGHMASIASGAYDAGAMIRTSGNIVILSPPLVLTWAEARQIVESLDAAFAGAKGNPAQ
jgi:putrescine---pyruvate transaminase